MIWTVPLSLKYRIAVIIFSLEVVMMTVVLSLTVSRFNASTTANIRDTESVIVRLLTTVARRALLTEDYAAAPLHPTPR